MFRENTYDCYFLPGEVVESDIDLGVLIYTASCRSRNMSLHSVYPNSSDFDLIRLLTAEAAKTLDKARSIYCRLEYRNSPLYDMFDSLVAGRKGRRAN